MLNSDLSVAKIRSFFHFPCIILVKIMLFDNQWKSKFVKQMFHFWVFEIFVPIFIPS